VTPCLTVTYCTCGALAAEAVALEETDCSWTTGVGDTGVGLLHTSLLGADIPVLTVWVGGALRATTCDGVWLGDQTRDTFTDRVASTIRGAGGSRPTGGRITGIRFLHASLTFAHKTVFAVWVDSALRSTACNSVWLGYQARLASADWVSVFVRGAGGSWTTGTGVTRIPHRALYLWGWVWHKTFWALAEWSPFLRNTHSITPTRIWITGI